MLARCIDILEAGIVVREFGGLNSSLNTPHMGSTLTGR